MTESSRPSEGALGLSWLSQWGCSPLLRLLPTLGADTLWSAPRRLLLDWGLPPQAAHRFESRRHSFSAADLLRRLEQEGLGFVPYGSEHYPPGLNHLSYPPAGLFIRGPHAALVRLGRVPRLALVGTRKASSYGIRATEAFAAAFARRGVAVVSGMAFGIDGRAHAAVLDEEGLTAAILGCGVDVIYPRRHTGLYRRIVRHGLVLSELPPGSPPARWTFPHRNRLLAAFSDAVLVVEGSRKSGALQTAGWALDLGRPVLSVPGPIMVENHEGCNALLYEGAAPALDPLTAVEDFLAATGIERGERAPPATAAGGAGASAEVGVPRLVEWPGGIGPDAWGIGVRGEGGSDTASDTAGVARSILEAVALGIASVDELVIHTGLPARQIAAALMRLELSGRVRRSGPGLFIRAP